MHLSEQEQRWLDGADGAALQLAMELLVAAAHATGATSFVPISFAHINSCHYSGQMSVDFAEFLWRERASFAVPTHTNASLIDCHTPTARPADLYPDEVGGAARLMEIYSSLGATSMWTCAPYLEPVARPPLGTHVAGSESNAVAFYNSALGARTNKYGDFLDVCAALTGRVPLAGLHTDEARVATHLVRVDLNERELADPTLPHLLGIILGTRCGTAVPVIDGLGPRTEDDLKAIAAAGATAGAIEMFHVVGTTPEAPTLLDALGGRKPVTETRVDHAMIADTRRTLSTRTTRRVDTVCLGTPHFSIDEFADLRRRLAGRRIHGDIALIVTTSRAVDAELALRGWRAELEACGVQIVLDTCSYYTPKMIDIGDHVMTNSAKWAYYAPGILDIDVTFAALQECLEAAVAGARS